MPKSRVASLAADSNISAGLVVAVRGMILDGRLSPGARVNEVQLAGQLGVSRTPLREALGRLVGEGALSDKARFGYYVRPLGLEDFNDLSALRGLVDPEALRLAGLPDAEGLKRLRALQQEIAAAGKAEDVVELDGSWQHELIGHGPNRALAELSLQLAARSGRYAMALMREQRNVHAVTHEHDKVMTALRAGNLKQACEALRQSLQSAAEPIQAWLAARPNEEPEIKSARNGDGQRRKKKLKK
jgi:DNA-binding GntR family transcriptional regulator